MSTLLKMVMRKIINDKRLIYRTIIAVALASALIFLTGILSSSIYQNQINQTLEKIGDYHLYTKEFRYDDVDIIYQYNNPKKVVIFNEIFTGIIDDKSETINYNKIGIYKVSKETIDNINIIFGRKPANENEIIISNRDSTHLGLEVNNNITISNNDIDQHYTITGIYEDVVGLMGPSNNTYYGITSGLFKDDDYVKAVITYKKLDNKIFETGKLLDSKLNFLTPNKKNNSGINYNFEFLSLHGITGGASLGTKGMIIFQMLIVLTIIGISAFFIIYNSFYISISEQKKYIGVLSSIGTSPPQIMLIVFLEGIFIYLIGLVIGFIVAVILLNLLLIYINTQLSEIINYHYSIFFNSLFLNISFIFTFITSLLAIFSTSMRAKDISPIDLIREKEMIINKKIKTNKLFLRLFGIEGEYARKNMKRNKSKFLISLISIVISIVLLVSFSVIVKILIANVDNLNPENNLSIRIELSRNNYLKEEIRSLKYIDEITEIENRNLMIEGISNYLSEYYFKYHYLSQNILSKNSEEYNSEKVKNNLKTISYNVLVIKDSDFNELIKKHNLPNDNIFALNMFDSSLTLDEERREQYYNLYNDSVIPSIKLCKYNLYYSEKLKSELGNCDYKISNIKVIFNILVDNRYIRNPTMIIKKTYYDSFSDYHYKLHFDNDINEDNMNNIIKQYYERNELNIISRNYLKFDSEIKKLFIENGLDITFTDDVYYSNELADISGTIKIFKTITNCIYLFLFYIALTAVVSVYNTIITLFNLRKKEFASLISLGLSNKSLRKIIGIESLILSLKAIIYSVPLIFITIILLFSSLDLGNSLNYDFNILVIGVPYQMIIVSYLAVLMTLICVNLIVIKKLKINNPIELIK